MTTHTIDIYNAKIDNLNPKLVTYELALRFDYWG